MYFKFSQKKNPVPFLQLCIDFIQNKKIFKNYLHLSVVYIQYQLVEFFLFTIYYININIFISDYFPQPLKQLFTHFFVFCSSFTTTNFPKNKKKSYYQKNRKKLTKIFVIYLLCQDICFFQLSKLTKQLLIAF